MQKLLLSAAGGSLFPYLFNILENKFNLYLMDSDSKVKYMYPDKKIFIVPKVNHHNFESEIMRIIKENNIDFYIPLIDEEIIKAIEISKKTNIKVLSPSRKFVELCLDKFKLMQILDRKNISNIPTSFANIFKNDDFDYPLFLKPNIGRGSRGIKKIDNINEFESYFILEKYSKDEVLVQPFIEGDEYTVSVTVNNLNEIIAIVPKLVFLKEGITKHACSKKNNLIETVCKEIVEKLSPKGSFNVQLKLYKNNVYIFEINPRFSTTLVLSVASGINEIELAINNYDNKNVNYISDFKEINLIRGWENYFYE